MYRLKDGLPLDVIIVYIKEAIINIFTYRIVFTTFESIKDSGFICEVEDMIQSQHNEVGSTHSIY